MSNGMCGEGWSAIMLMALSMFESRYMAGDIRIWLVADGDQHSLLTRSQLS